VDADFCLGDNPDAPYKLRDVSLCLPENSRRAIAFPPLQQGRDSVLTAFAITLAVLTLPCPWSYHLSLWPPDVEFADVAGRLDEHDVFVHLQFLEDERSQVLEADLIVSGEVVSKEAYQHESGAVLTAYSVDVGSVLKGRPEGTTVVTSLLGGELDGRVTSFSGGLDHPEVGERYVFMLSLDERWRPGDYRGGGPSQRHRVVGDTVVEKGIPYRDFVRRIQEQLTPLSTAGHRELSDAVVRGAVSEVHVYPMVPRAREAFLEDPNTMLLKVTDDLGAEAFQTGDLVRVELPPHFHGLVGLDEEALDGEYLVYLREGVNGSWCLVDGLESLTAPDAAACSDCPAGWVWHADFDPVAGEVEVSPGSYSGAKRDAPFPLPASVFRAGALSEAIAGERGLEPRPASSAVCVFDVSGEARRARLFEGTTAVEVSADRSTVLLSRATGERGEVEIVCETLEGEELFRRTMPEGRGWLGPDGNALLWRHERGAELWTLDGERRKRVGGFNDYVRRLDSRFSPTGQRVAVVLSEEPDEYGWPGSRLTVVDVPTGRTVRSADLGPVAEATLAWHEDVLHVACTFARGRGETEHPPAKLFAVSPEGKLTQTTCTEAGPAERVRLAVSDDGATAYLTIGTAGLFPVGQAWRYSTGTLALLGTVDVGDFQVLDIACGPDGAVGFFGRTTDGGPRELRVFDGEELRTVMEWPWDITSMRETPAGDALLFAGRAPHDEWTELYALRWHDALKRFELRVP